VYTYLNDFGNILGFFPSNCADQFQAERAVPKYIQKHYGTLSPDHANYYLIDHDFSCFYTDKKTKRKKLLQRQIIDQYLYRIVFNFVHDHPYFNRSCGHDHLIVFTVDRGRCQFSVNANPLHRSWFRYFENVTFIGNFGFSGTMVSYSIIQFGHACTQASNFMIQNATCTKLNGLKDIVIPQYHFFSTDEMKLNLYLNNFHSIYQTNIYFRGVIKCGGVSSRNMRPYLLNLTKLYLNDKYSVQDTRQTIANKTRSILLKENLSSRKNGSLPKGGYFSLCPGGSAPWSLRLYDALFHYSIPIILSDQVILPFERFLQWQDFTIKFQSEYFYAHSTEIIQRIDKHIREFKSLLQTALESQQHENMRGTRDGKNSNSRRQHRLRKLLTNNYIYNKLSAIEANLKWFQWQETKDFPSVNLHRNISPVVKGNATGIQVHNAVSYNRWDVRTGPDRDGAFQRTDREERISTVMNGLHGIPGGSAYTLLVLELWCRLDRHRQSSICRGDSAVIANLSYW